MPNPTLQDSALRTWWEPEREGGTSILVAMLDREWPSGRLRSDLRGPAARCRDVLGRLLRAGVRRPAGIRAGRNRRRIGLASLRDFGEGRGGAHATDAAGRVQIRRFNGEHRLVAAAYYAGEKPIKKQGLRCADADICRYVSEVQRFYLKRQM